MRSRSAIEFQDVVAATFVVGTDLIESDFLTLQEAIDNLPTLGGRVFMLGGSFTQTAAITLPDKAVAIAGSGIGITTIVGKTASNFFTSTHDRHYIIQDLSFTADSSTGQVFFNQTGALALAEFIDLQILGGVEKVFKFSAFSTVIATRCRFDMVAVAASRLVDASASGARVEMSGVLATVGSGGISGTGVTLIATDSRFSVANGFALQDNCLLEDCIFIGAGSVTLSGASHSVHGCSFLTGAFLTVTATSVSVVGCNFNDNGATVTRFIDITSVSTPSGNVTGCTFGTATSEAIRIATTNWTIIGNTNCKVLETGGADSNRYDDNTGFSASTIIGAASTVNGAAKADKASTTTNALVEIVPTITNPKGLVGFGTVKNTDGANSLDVKESFTDAFGTTSTLTTTVTFGNSLLLGLQQNIGTGFPPYVSYKAEVIDTVGGSHATFVSHFTSQGSL